MGVYGVVDEIFSSPLTTLSDFFRHFVSARHGQIFPVRIEVNSRLRPWLHHHFFAITSWRTNFFGKSTTTGELFSRRSAVDILIGNIGTAL